MARNRTSTSGGQDLNPAPASRNPIRGRGRGRARGRGRGRVAAPVDGQVPIATQGRDRTVPPMQRLFMGMCMIVSRGMGQLLLHPVLLFPKCFKIPWLVC